MDVQERRLYHGTASAHCSSYHRAAIPHNTALAPDAARASAGVDACSGPAARLQLPPLRVVRSLESPGAHVPRALCVSSPPGLDRAPSALPTLACSCAMTQTFGLSSERSQTRKFSAGCHTLRGTCWKRSHAHQSPSRLVLGPNET